MRIAQLLHKKWHEVSLWVLYFVFDLSIYSWVASYLVQCCCRSFVGAVFVVVVVCGVVCCQFLGGCACLRLFVVRWVFESICVEDVLGLS